MAEALCIIIIYEGVSKFNYIVYIVLLRKELSLLYLVTEVVAVYCDQSEDTFSKIVCAVSDKFYIFDIQKTPDIMSKGKLAEFFSTGNSQEPWKVTKYNNDNSFLNKTM
jgi:hypothetical protein